MSFIQRDRTARHGVAMLLASTMLTASGAAWAQDAAGTGNVDEVIVTAQKRSENLQTVPISIQALGTQKLEQLNIANFNDYTKMLPSVSFQTSQPGTSQVYFRGVASGGDGNHSGSLPSVGVYLDEQPVTTIDGALDVHVYDVARIEALAGPQGTLYGASSQAGTIRIITNKPDHKGVYGALDAEVNRVKSGEFGHKIEGFVNVPINDKVATRLVGFYKHDGGYIDNVAATRSFLPNPGGLSVSNSQYVKKNYNDVDVYGGRAALKVDLDNNWTATATVFAQDQKSNGTFGSDPSVGDLQVQHFGEESRHDRFVQGALTIEGKIGNWDATYAGAYMKRQIDSQSDYTDYAEAYDALYADYGGFAGYFYITDNAGDQVIPSQHIVGEDEFTKESHEFRIASPQDKRLRVVGGAFYQKQYHMIHQDYQITGLADALSVNGMPGTLWLTQQERVDKDYAAFGEVSFDILSNLTLTGGLRAFKYDNSLIGFFGFGRNPDGPPYNGAGSSRTGVAGCYTTTGATLRDNPGGTLLPAAVGGSPCTNLGVFNNGRIDPKRVRDNGTIHRLNLTWKPSDDQLLYGTWSRGFRPGGINRRSTITPYQADFLTNYELGFKTSWMDRKVKLNGAVYMQDWKKFQFAFLGQNSFTEIHNGPDARIKGLELDASYRITDRLTVSGSGAFTDAKTLNNLCAIDDPTYACTDEDNSIAAKKGTRLPVTPKVKANIMARYVYPLANGDAHFQAVIVHQGSATSDIRTAKADLLGDIRSYTTVDVAYGIDWPRYSVELYIDNLFDERAELSRYVQCGQCYSRYYIVPTTPQTIGLRGGYKF